MLAVQSDDDDICLVLAVAGVFGELDDVGCDDLSEERAWIEAQRSQEQSV